MLFFTPFPSSLTLVRSEQCPWNVLVPSQYCSVWMVPRRGRKNGEPVSGPPHHPSPYSALSPVSSACALRPLPVSLPLTILSSARLHTSGSLRAALSSSCLVDVSCGRLVLPGVDERSRHAWTCLLSWLRLLVLLRDPALNSQLHVSLAVSSSGDSERSE